MSTTPKTSRMGQLILAVALVSVAGNVWQWLQPKGDAEKKPPSSSQQELEKVLERVKGLDKEVDSVKTGLIQGLKMLDKEKKDSAIQAAQFILEQSKNSESSKANPSPEASSEETKK
jgi:hypothetical protein